MKINRTHLCFFNLFLNISNGKQQTTKTNNEHTTKGMEANTAQNKTQQHKMENKQNERNTTTNTHNEQTTKNKEMDELGSIRTHCSLFGKSRSPNHVIDATILVAGTVVRKQKGVVDDVVSNGGSLAVLGWELDATPQYVQLMDRGAACMLSGVKKQHGSHNNKGAREVLVQRGRLITLCVDLCRNVDDVIFAKMRLLGSEHAGTLLDAVMSEMQAAGCGLEELAHKFDDVVLCPAIDGAAACELMLNYLRCVLGYLPNLMVSASDPCLLHCLNRVFMIHAKHSALSRCIFLDIEAHVYWQLL